jgi:hypothetical protein
MASIGPRPGGVGDDEHHPKIRAGSDAGRYGRRRDAGREHRRICAVPRQMSEQVVDLSFVGRLLTEGVDTMKKLVLAAMLAVMAIAALPVLSTSALAQCPPKCEQK